MTTDFKQCSHHFVMKASRNSPEVVQLDLLNDLIARLDVLLDEVDRSTDQFLAQLRADPSQGSSTTAATDDSEATLMDIELKRLLRVRDHAVRRESRDIRRILLELHALHARLGSLLDELDAEQIPRHESATTGNDR